MSEVDFENQHYWGARAHRAVPLLNAVHLARPPFSQLTAVSHLAVAAGLCGLQRTDKISTHHHIEALNKVHLLLLESNLVK